MDILRDVTAGFLLLAMLAGCSKHDEVEGPSAAKTINAQTATIQLQTVPSFVEIAGTLEGQQVVPIATKLMSAITYMGFEEGQRVQSGDVLARIDDSDISAMRNEAAAFRAEAVGVMAEVEAAIAQGEAATTQAVAGFAQAVAANVDAQADAKRFRKLVGEDVVAPMQAEKYELAAGVAAENVTLAEAAVAAAQAGVSQAESKVPQVTAKQNQAAAKDAQAAALQNYATLTAPFDGVVIARLADVGQLAIPGQPLYQLADDSGFRVILAVAENVALGLSVGESAEVVLDAGGAGHGTVTGEIIVIGGAADPATHTIRVEVRIDSQPGLLSGMFARVNLRAGERQVILVPATAIIYEGDLTSVWRVSDSGLVNKVPVDAGPVRYGMVVVYKGSSTYDTRIEVPIYDGMVEVFRGLSAGDTVVTVPPEMIFAGARVQSNSGTGK